MKETFIEKISKGNKSVLLIGTTHTQNDVELSQIKNAFFKFSPKIVLVEDAFDKAEFSSEESSIKLGGEMGLVSFISKQNKTKIISNDPSFRRELRFLESNFGRDFTFLYFFLRERSYLLGKPAFSPPSEQEIVLRIKKEISWENYDYSFSHLVKISSEIIKKDWNNKEIVDFFNPLLIKHSFNEATRMLNTFRDDFMIETIRTSLKTNNKILVIKGRHHIFTMHEKIKELLEK